MLGLFAMERAMFEYGPADRKIYPGYFDVLKMTSDRTKQSEIVNGRLAMVACAGRCCFVCMGGRVNEFEGEGHPTASLVKGACLRPRWRSSNPSSHAHLPTPTRPPMLGQFYATGNYSCPLFQ